MKRLLVLLLVASLGLNVGLLWQRHRLSQPTPWEGSMPLCDRPGTAPLPRPGMFPGPPGDPGSWVREVAPRVHEQRLQVRRARLALRRALARPELDEGEIGRCLGALAAAQQRLDSLVAFSLVERLRPLPPEERRRWLDRLPWGSPPGRGHRRGGRIPDPVPSP